MKMLSRSPKNVFEAMGLKEVNGFDGVFFGSGGLDGDSICAFVDADGFLKRVHCVRLGSAEAPDEWVKSRVL